LGVLLSPFEGGYRGMTKKKSNPPPFVPPPAGDKVEDVFSEGVDKSHTITHFWVCYCPPLKGDTGG